MVAAGQAHTGIVTDCGRLLMCGKGDDGQLGLGNQADRMTPTQIDPALFHYEKVLMVACGERHTAAVTEGGVFTFGSGKFGQLGHGNEASGLLPTRVRADLFNGEQVILLAAGVAHTVALSKEGKVYTWGYGEYGQLGHNNKQRQSVPRQVEPDRFQGGTVVFVAAGGCHSSAITTDEQLHVWGWGAHGQLGHGTRDNALVPEAVDTGAFGGSPVAMAACGDYHTLVVTCSGALWACGNGGCGQLGLNDREGRLYFARVGLAEFGNSEIVAAAAGHLHSIVVTKEGGILTWGDGARGRLGHLDEAGFGEVVREPEGVEGGALTLGGREDRLGRGRWAVRRRDRDGGGSWLQRGSRLLPGPVAAEGFQCARLGRYRALPAAHALAFVMGTHARLGAASGDADAGDLLGGQAARATASPSESPGESARSSISRSPTLSGLAGDSNEEPHAENGIQILPARASGTGYNLESLAGEEGLVSMIARLCLAWPSGPARCEEGVVRLLGGLELLSHWERERERERERDRQTETGRDRE